MLEEELKRLACGQQPRHNQGAGTGIIKTLVIASMNGMMV